MTIQENRMDKGIRNITDSLPHRTSMVICLKCYFRWLAIRPVQVRLDQLECKECGPGYVIETGEILE